MTEAETANPSEGAPVLTFAPPVCALIEVISGGQVYQMKVAGYLKHAPRSDFTGDGISAALFDTAPDIFGGKMRLCLRKDASHVYLVGKPRGAVAAVRNCRVIGMADMPPDEIERATRTAEALGKSGALVF